MNRFLLLVLAVLALNGCSRLDRHASDVVEIAERATSANSNGGATSERWTEGVATVRAEGFDNVPPFETAARERAISKFPCIECHSKPLETLRVTGQKDKKASHWDLKLDHGKPGAMNCNNCHNYEDFSTLKTLTGKPVGLNHSYQVCGQCHSKQLADWAGGAHGKRLGGWAPPRIAQNCAGCHNPHRPRLDARWPSVAGRLDGKGGDHQ